MSDFMECATCAAKPGSPQLCASCLHNRADLAKARAKSEERRRLLEKHRIGLIERQPILGEVPTEFFEGEWHFPKADGPEPWAVITYTDEPSPETGHVGWCWWALGMMGDAPTYEDAKRKAETWIQARINGMPASGRWA